MAKVTALEAKNGFGQFLDLVQRAPVTLTKTGREVGAMFSKTDLEAMAAAYLSGPLRGAVAEGMPIGDALMRQAEMDRQLDEAEEDVAAGRVQVADAAFFEELREHVRRVSAKT